MLGEELAKAKSVSIFEHRTEHPVIRLDHRPIWKRKTNPGVLNPSPKRTVHRGRGPVGIFREHFPEKEIRTEGQKEGDSYRLFGRKRQVINAPLADWLAVTAKTQGQWAVFLVKPGQGGLTIGEPLKTLGYKDLAMSEVNLDRCVVPEDRVIGPFTDFAPLTELKTRTNLMIAVSSLGVMERALQGAKNMPGKVRTMASRPRPIKKSALSWPRCFLSGRLLNGCFTRRPGC